ncbi:MAG: hypothetical protein R3247_00845 [Rhodothermales bacterium]|nr:hypothetical protein [Rhodothermales bacterium]
MGTTGKGLPRGIRVLVAGAVDVERTQYGASRGQKTPRAQRKGARVLAFCEALGQALAATSEDKGTVLITGGRSRPRSADLALIRGARTVLDAATLEKHVVTYPPPGPKYVMAPEFEGTHRVPARGSTRQARRFQMVRAADVVVSVAGSTGGPECIRLAQALELPALPLLFTGAASARMEEDAESFGLGKEEITEWLRLAEEPDADLTPYAGRVVDLTMERALLPCFVAMPYGDASVETMYEVSIRPAIREAGYRPIRSDEESRPGVILTQMLDAIQEAGAMVALLSDERYRRHEAGGTDGGGGTEVQGSAAVNPNVMYEVGYARALGIPCVLLAEDAGALPFDLRVDRTIDYGSRFLGATRNAICKALRTVRTPRSMDSARGDRAG